jgi:FlaG/FlaF family flagellin (archaellin)
MLEAKAVGLVREPRQMFTRGSDGGDRGLSREGVAALGFGLTIVMMAVVGGVLMGVGDSLSGSGPVVSATAEPVVPGDGPDDQWVRIRHDSGDTIAVENLTVEVWIPAHRMRATLHNLPTAKINRTWTDYDGNHVFTTGEGGIAGEIDADETDGAWSSTETIGFRIEDRRVPLEDGQEVVVTVRHEPSETKLTKLRVTVGDR